LLGGLVPMYARKHQLQNTLIYHIYNRSHRGEYIFESKKDFEHFSDLLCRLKEDYEVKIYHWVIMSNHYHLCLKLDTPEIMSKCMSGLQRAYTHYYNRTRKVRGYLWESRFKSQPIEGENYLLACGRYIERNPVRAKMVKDPAQYFYSSARYYCLGAQDKITDTNLYYDEFGDSIRDKQRGYCKYLNSYDENQEDIFREIKLPVGSQSFRMRLVKKDGHYFPKRRGRPRGNQDQEGINS